MIVELVKMMSGVDGGRTVCLICRECSGGT